MAEENTHQDGLENSAVSVICNFFKSITGQVNLTDEQIEARRKDYRKCKKCGEINDLNELICWKCGASRGQDYDHPVREDLKKYLQKKILKGLFLLGVAFFIAAGGVLITGYILDSHRDNFPDVFTIGFAAILALPGIILMIYWLIRKVSAKYPQSKHH